MNRRITIHRKKPGLSPGTVAYAGERKGPVSIAVIDYRGDTLIERPNVPLDDAIKYLDRDSVTWIDVDGVHDATIVQTLGDKLGLHTLIQEDIVSPRQRPKVEKDGEHLYIVLRMLDYDENTRRVHSEQISIIVGRGHVVTFKEDPGDVFDLLRQRVRSTSGRIRKRGPAYLAYALIDSIVDHYFIVLDRVSEVVDELEDEILSGPDQSTQARVHDLRRELILVRRAVWPVRELLTALEKTEGSPFSRDLKPFLSDAADHVIQVIETIEVLREATTGLLDLYYLSISNRANEIMKLLTMIATVFIPLTFVAGIYGMNFDVMPELRWHFGYPLTVAVMALIATLLLIYFRRKRWI